MSDLGTIKPDDGLLSCAKEKLPDYLIKIREAFILDMKSADELTSPFAIRQESYKIRFENFWKADGYNLETMMAW